MTNQPLFQPQLAKISRKSFLVGLLTLCACKISKIPEERQPDPDLGQDLEEFRSPGRPTGGGM